MQRARNVLVDMEIVYKTLQVAGTDYWLLLD